MPAFTYQIVTPDGSFASGVCEFLVIPTSRGEIGILANHQPLLSDIVSGELRISRAGATERFHVGKGILELAGNAATLLVEEAVTRIEEGAPASGGARAPAQDRPGE
jgi:F-type H+-transporting ATPase subunit epsilon